MSLSIELDCLVEMMPCIHTLQFRSDRDVQDFWERDFDRQLAIINTKALVKIAESLEVLTLDRNAAVG